MKEFSSAPPSPTSTPSTLRPSPLTDPRDLITMDELRNEISEWRAGRDENQANIDKVQERPGGRGAGRWAEDRGGWVNQQASLTHPSLAPSLTRSHTHEQTKVNRSKVVDNLVAPNSGLAPEVRSATPPRRRRWPSLTRTSQLTAPGGAL